MTILNLKAQSKRHPIAYIKQAMPFILVHLACFLVFWTGVTKASFIICVTLYFLRMWAVTAGYHRYFSHKSYKTSRIFQFILAFLAQSSLQRGVLIWANDHRKHHLYSDTSQDPHSPRVHGLFYSHTGWFFAKETYDDLQYSMMNDFKKYPELVWLDKIKHIPGVILAVLTYLIAGWPGLIVGFFISTVLVFHCTFFINSLTHRFGKQRYLTGDDSRNHWLLALLTFGEGWHNNHHHYPASVRQGFFWWEIDITYYILKLLERLHIVWDLKTPSADVIHFDNSLSPRAINRSMRFLKNAGMDFSFVNKKLVTIKDYTLLETQNQELKHLCDTLKLKLMMIKKFPPKVKYFVKSNLENSILLLSTLIDHSHENAVSLAQRITVIDEVLQLRLFQNYE